jgi:hypothetical protein
MSPFEATMSSFEHDALYLWYAMLSLKDIKGSYESYMVSLKDDVRSS